SLCVLFILNSRFSFAAFILVITCYFYCKNWRVSLIASAIAIFLLFISSAFLIDYLGSDHRMVRLFMMETDSSLNERSLLMLNELHNLKYNWLFGKYMYDVIASGAPGYYAHNYVSFLSAYGLGPSLTLLALTFVCL